MIDIINNTSYRIGKSKTKHLVERLLKMYGFSSKVGVEVVLVDTKTIQKYNHDFRNKNKVTNVLSFPAIIDPDSKRKQLLGTIMICPEYIIKKENNHEFFKYIIHGFLHLLGYDHDTDKNELAFYKESKQISKYFNLKKIY